MFRRRKLWQINKNPEVDKENEAYASDESLSNNGMKRRSWDFTNTFFYHLFIAIAYTVLLWVSFQWERGLHWLLYFLGIHMISFVVQLSSCGMEKRRAINQLFI